MDQNHFDRMTRMSASGTSRHWHPLARQDHLVMNRAGDEVLVYDETVHAIHHLNPTSQAVWSLCNGARTPADIGRRVGAALRAEVPDEVVRLALRQLAEAQLLVDGLPSKERAPRRSRRVLLKQMAIAGGIALPAIASVSAPRAVHATSHCGSDGHACGFTGQDCCSGFFCYSLPTGCRPESCGRGGDSCFLNSQCCSNNCLFGTRCEM